jgi:hypothetical protein
MAIKDRLKSLEAKSAPLAAAQWYQECADEELGPLLVSTLLYLIRFDVLQKPGPEILARLEAVEATGEQIALEDGDEGEAQFIALVSVLWYVFLQVPSCCHASHARQTALELSRGCLATVRADIETWPLPRVAALLDKLNEGYDGRCKFSDMEALACVRNFTWSTP